MTGKQVRQIKSRWQFALGVTLATSVCLLSGWVVFHRFMSITTPSPSLEPLAPNGNLNTMERPRPVPNVQPVPTSTTAQSASVPAKAQTVAQPAIEKASTRLGVFRVSNPTSYPVRVALLPKKAADAKTAQTSEPTYEPPAHWDFAPEEGGAQGLLVSLPDRTLKLKKGDVLVAFAQDGSGRYWGPYVVDETALPVWNAKAVEWQLILQP
ncbi:MAG: hypothetical protein ACAF41_15085 [Leptolyngbya sp. BL-A-14]